MYDNSLFSSKDRFGSRVQMFERLKNATDPTLFVEARLAAALGLSWRQKWVTSHFTVLTPLLPLPSGK